MNKVVEFGSHVFLVNFFEVSMFENIVQTLYATCGALAIWMAVIDVTVDNLGAIHSPGCVGDCISMIRKILQVFNEHPFTLGLIDIDGFQKKPPPFIKI